MKKLIIVGKHCPDFPVSKVSQLIGEESERQLIKKTTDGQLRLQDFDRKSWLSRILVQLNQIMQIAYEAGVGWDENHASGILELYKKWRSKLTYCNALPY